VADGVWDAVRVDVAVDTGVPVPLLVVAGARLLDGVPLAAMVDDGDAVDGGLMEPVRDAVGVAVGDDAANASTRETVMHGALAA